MVTLAATHPTLLDLSKRLDPEDKIDKIIEMQAQTNELWQDAVWLPSNQMTGHRTTIRTGLPTPTWKKLYGGVQPTKSTTAQITDTIGMLANYAEVDKDLVELNGNTAAFRLSEDQAVIEGINQEASRAVFYENEATNSERITGFAPRFNDQSATNGENIITNAATPDSTDNTSIWLVVWGPSTCHMIYPKGTKAGLGVEDKGQVTVENVDGANGRSEMYRTYYTWKMGLCVRDWRYIVRINFDLEDVNATQIGTSGRTIMDEMAKAMRRVPSLSMGRPAFYLNRDAWDALDFQSIHVPTLAFRNVEDAQGKFITTFRNIPLRRMDALTSTEAGI